MTETRSAESTTASFHRDRAPCKRCGETIETDVPACPHCGNQPLAAIKGGSVVAMFVGTILAVTTSNAALVVWYGPLVGVGLFCAGVGVFWVVTERYSPTEHDASGPTPTPSRRRSITDGPAEPAGSAAIEAARGRVHCGRHAPVRVRETGDPENSE